MKNVEVNVLTVLVVNEKVTKLTSKENRKIEDIRVKDTIKIIDIVSCQS